jgi:hypothetical protein
MMTRAVGAICRKVCRIQGIGTTVASRSRIAKPAATMKRGRVEETTWINKEENYGNISFHCSSGDRVYHLYP